ncbi:MAG: molybdopterin-dependent oxidoreductase [Lentisphaerae bacterium]|nr:molybdopterin-dependent oxidoreductase [Lentisphaerota bacterium]
MLRNVDTPLHVRGESVFVDDLPEPDGTLHGAVCASPVAHGGLRAIHLDDARACPGVVRILTAADIPGQNEIGNIIADEPLLAECAVHYVGQPVALVVARTPEAAREAVTRVRLDIDEQPPVLDPRAAAAAGHFIAPPRRLVLGDVDATWAHCQTVLEGRVDSGGQEHLYLEMQGAMAVPDEKGHLRVYSSTQGPTAVQRTVARVLGLGMHAVQVEVRRLGGGFGGKEDQATAWAVLAALGACLLRRPVKVVLRRGEDMRMTGKRHPYSSDYRIGLDGAGKILAFEATYYQNAGAAADLSTAVLERTLFHSTNSYHIPNVRVTGMSCRTNLPPFTAFRGFGGPQGMFVIESAIARAADACGLPAWELQRRNLLEADSVFPYGMRVYDPRARRCFEEALARYHWEDWQREAAAFNAANRRFKRGLSAMPVCFGISFTNTMLNQAGALVHVYTDGSVGVSTAAVEMGQGVNTKILRVVARTLGIPDARVSIDSTDTRRVANTSPTAASAAADLNGMAAQLACQAVLERLRGVAAALLGAAGRLAIHDGRVQVDGRATDLTWEQLVAAAYMRRTNLSAQAYFATPDIHYDKTTEQGEPFRYHVFGTALTQVTVDGLRGTYTLDAVRMVHDAGASLDVLIDRGQAEGALLQGIAWVTLEDLLFDAKGRLMSNSLTNYKVPDLHFAPREVDVAFLEEAGNPRAVLQSKAIGEPPLMYGIGTYFAILSALRALRPGRPGVYDAPLTPEKVLRFLYA